MLRKKRTNPLRKLAVAAIGICIVAGLALVATNPPSSKPHGMEKHDTFDYLISSKLVMNQNGTVAYAGDDFTAALSWAVSQAGKAIYVPAGTYNVNDTIEVASGVTLFGSGDGTDGTILNFTRMRNVELVLTGVDNVVMKQFRMTGSGNILIRSPTTAVDGKASFGNITIQDVTAYGTSSTTYLGGAFWTYAMETMNIDGLKFIRCKALYTNTFGFGIYGDIDTEPGTEMESLRSLNVWVRNISFEDCQASGCGVSERPNNYVCGFDLAEGTNTENVTLTRCSATGNWMDGFHWEGTLYVNKVVLYDCNASYNGVGKVSGHSNAGYNWYPQTPYGNDVTLVACTAEGNYGGDTNTGMALPPTG